MRRMMGSLLVLGLFTLPLAGCGGEESKVEETQTVETPSGTTEVNKEISVEKSGEAPPAAPGEPAAPPAAP